MEVFLASIHNLQSCITSELAGLSSHVSFFMLNVKQESCEDQFLKYLRLNQPENRTQVYRLQVRRSNPKPRAGYVVCRLVLAWVRIPFAAIFTDISRGWFKLMTFCRLFSNIIRRISSLANKAAFVWLFRLGARPGRMHWCLFVRKCDK